MSLDNGDYLDELGGLPAFDFDEGQSELPAPDAVAWRISVGCFDEELDWSELFDRFAAVVDISRVVSLIVGDWEDSYDTGPRGAIDSLARARERMPALRHVFLGDITGEQCELSWINQTDIHLLLSELPLLEALGVRGGTELEWTPLRHERLRSLTVQTGGLPAAVLRGIAACDFPALAELDLWLGVSDYGGDATVDDLRPFLDGGGLPALRSLGLRNSPLQDEIAAACGSAPVVALLEKLDLSKGTLSDDGATALLDGQPLTHLNVLDLRHHFLTEPMVRRIEETLSPAGVALKLDRDDAWEESFSDGRTWRSVALSE